MAGPYTPKAMGDAMPEMEAPQMNTGAPEVSTMTAPTAPPVYDPGNPNAFAQRGTFTLGQPDVRAYPSSFQQDDNPNVFQFREGNVYVPHAGNLAMDLLYNRGAEITKRKQAIDDQIKNFDLYANIGKAPTDYEKNFRQLAVNDLNSFRKNLADTYYGGDTRAADKAILSDPTMNRAWKERSKQWEIFGRQAQERFDDAANFKALYEAGKVERSPLAQRRYETALNVLRATGNFGANGQGDPGEIIRGWDRADQQQSLEQWIKEQVMPNAKYALQTLQDRGELVKGPNGFRFFNEDKRKSFEQLRDYARREALSWGYPAEDVDIALKGVFPDSYIEETKVIQPRAAKGKSGGSNEVAYSATYEHAPVNASGFTPGVNLDQVTLTDTVSKRGTTPQARSFVVDRSGTTRSVIPERIVRSGDDLFIVGKEADYRGQEDIAPPYETYRSGVDVPKGAIRDGWEFIADTGGDPRDPKNWKQVRDLTEAKTVVVPYVLNEGKVNAYFPGLTREKILGAIEEGRANLQRARSSATSSPKSATRDQIKSLVGTKGYEGYSEQELIDYYKSQGYTIQ